jgi:phage shock protein E
MTIFSKAVGLTTLLALATACAQNHYAGDAQQASVFSLADTTGHDLDAQQANEWLEANPQTVVLDVRTPEEYRMGHIKKAQNINLYDAKFVNKLAALDRSKPYVVHCAAGLTNGRSRKAVALMDSLGFKHIYHLNGGFNGWKQAEWPVVANQ